MKHLRHLHLVGATGQIRTATYNDREHLVVPVVAMVEGVVWASNSDVPEFVSAEELAQTPHQWNGRGCFAGHPKDGDTQVTANTPRTLEKSFGVIFETASAERILQTRSLEFNVWVDPIKAEQIGPRELNVVRRLQADERLEVSIGAFVEIDDKDGRFNGLEFHGAWQDIVSDHVAFLDEDTEGACSVAAGCGAPRTAVRHMIRHAAEGGLPMSITRLAAPGQTPPSTPPAAPGPKSQPTGPQPSQPTGPKRGLREKLLSMFSQLRSSEPGLSDVDVRRAVETALRAVEPGFMGVDEVFLEGSDELSNAHVVYSVMPEDEWLTKRRSFTMTDGGVATLTEDAIEVEMITKYQPIRAASAAHTPCSCGGQQARQLEPAPTEEKKPMRADIKALIDAGRFTAADAAWLESVPADHLATLTKKDEPAPVPEPKAAATKEQSEEEWLKTAPASVREEFAELRAAKAAKKAGLIAELKAAADGAFTDAELAEKSISELEKLKKFAKIADPEPDYGNRAFPRSAAASQAKEDHTPPDSYGMTNTKH